MQPVWRNPALVVGLVLLFLGLGNWLVSWNKISEYSHRVRSRQVRQEIQALTDFPALTPQTNAALLQHLSSSDLDYSSAQAKLDFYRVVERGGRALSLAGLLLIALALVQHWRRHDHQVTA